MVGETPVILLAAPLVGQRLGYADISGLDLLELFAFVHPAEFAVPTPAGLARALGVHVDAAAGDGGVPRLLLACTARLLATLNDPDWAKRHGAFDAASALARVRWPWAAAVGARLTPPTKHERSVFLALPEWEEAPPRPQPRPVQVRGESAVAHLATLTGEGAEPREGQRAMAAAVAATYAPRRTKGAPNLLLAEAGTGIGKTLAYLAPADLWSRASGGTVHISTYTKALQRQLARETRRLYPGEGEHRGAVAVRKGRENYLCLLNLEDAVQGAFQGRAAVLARLVARWAMYSRDGDMVGGDLPGWLPTLFRRAGATALTDRRGECIYAACPHWKRCFVERSARSAEQASIVVANHALTMINAARGRTGDHPPTRLVFDEGHHLFDAADSVFAVALSGQEGIELRRWIVGPEGRSRGRRRGLSARLADVVAEDEAGAAAIDAARLAAMALPGDGWLTRLVEGTPAGPIEALLAAVRAQVFVRDASSDRPDGDAGYGLEAELADPDPALVEAAAEAAVAIEALIRPLDVLARRLEALVEEAPDWLDGATRARIDGALSSLSWRRETLSAWLGLVARVGGPADERFIDWLSVDRIDGREIDVGLHRRWLDPTLPLAETVLSPAHGVTVASATLALGDWDRADRRTGALHLPAPPQHFAAESPFDYASRAEVLIITDIRRGDLAGLAQAYARLIVANDGGTLGLFTAIRRLRSVHARIADHLARAGLALYAQHVDPIDVGTLVDVFRDDPRATLLGTDALRDGVDVPGDSLRQVIMEGVPWVKPSVVHAARRLANGGSAYDDELIRTRLAQAFGRLIRRADDAGRFILLSSAVPSRLLNAFPPGTPIIRCTLDTAIARVEARPVRGGTDTPDPFTAPVRSGTAGA